MTIACTLAPEANALPIKQTVPFEARPLDLSCVRLTGGPLKHAQDLDGKYLLELDVDRMLSGFRKQAGLKPKAQPYGGWDSEGRSLAGHIAGHYLSAVSYMWAATGDKRYKQRADEVVQGLMQAQQASKDGFLGAQDGMRKCFEEVSQGVIRSAGFDLNGLWVPFYVQHKVFAGLRDAYRLTGNKQALTVEVKLAEYTNGIVGHLSDAQMQTLMRSEFGGMNEVLADLYVDTGDKRWLHLSDQFEHHAVLDPLARHQDILSGLHGNTQVPKMVGALERFIYTGDTADGFAAGFFWDRVVQHHSYATGGHGKDEYFGDPDKLSHRVDGRTAETCNVYNMLKLTRKLFALHPDAHYAEFQERALFNHILASIDPEDGRTCYMTPVGRSVTREYQDMFEGFTCCVGTGMESHALHGDGIYYEAGNKLWVNIYTPSTAEWRSAGAHLDMQTTMPEGDRAQLSLTLLAPKQLTLALRRPAWAGDGFTVEVNGQPVTDLPKPGGYVRIERTWSTGDKVTLVMPKVLRLEPLPDNPNRVAILWGPLVLAGDMGPEGEHASWEPGAIPVFVAAGKPVADWLIPIEGRTGCFRTVGVGRNREVEFSPFYRLQRRTYGVYWDLYTPDEWEQQATEHAKEQEKAAKLAAATVAFVQPGEMQPERDYHMQGDNTSADRVHGRACRRAQGWFSFDLPVDPAHPMTLMVTYNTDEWRKRTFEILVDGVVIGSQVVERGGEPRFFDVHYPIAAELVRSKSKVTVKFVPTNGNEVAAVFGVRMYRGDSPQ